MQVSIHVRKAEQNPHDPRLWSVEFGPDSFVHEQNGSYPDFPSLKSRLEEVARTLAFDPRLAKWPGVCVSATNEGTRKPNGWDANRHNQSAYVKIIGRAD